MVFLVPLIHHLEAPNRLADFPNLLAAESQLSVHLMRLTLLYALQNPLVEQLNFFFVNADHGFAEIF